jgi:hypothetical protein
MVLCLLNIIVLTALLRNKALLLVHLNTSTTRPQLRPRSRLESQLGTNAANSILNMALRHSRKDRQVVVISTSRIEQTSSLEVKLLNRRSRVVSPLRLDGS